jgi:carbamate kinase
MLIIAGNKGEQVSEDNNTFRRVVLSPSCHPQGETDQPVTKHINGEKLRVS